MATAHNNALVLHIALSFQSELLTFWINSLWKKKSQLGYDLFWGYVVVEVA